MLTRRTFLGGALLPLVPAVPAQTLPDEAARLGAEWRATLDHATAVGRSVPEETFDALMDRTYELEDRLKATTATTPEGVVAKLRVLAEQMKDSEDPIKEWAHSALADLERLATSH